jgi:hypothetical protein
VREPHQQHRPSIQIASWSRTPFIGTDEHSPKLCLAKCRASRAFSLGMALRRDLIVLLIHAGTKLIERAIPGATVHGDFRAEGLVCTVKMALPG